MPLAHGGCVVGLALLVGTLGCSSGDDGDGGSASGDGVSAATIASYEGTYQLDSLTENTAGCDAEGPSIVTGTTDPMFVMVGVNALGIGLVELASCSDTADCESAVAAIRQPAAFTPDYSLLFSTEAGPDALGGLTAWSGYDMNGICVGREYDRHELARSGDDVRVESRTTPLADKSSDKGTCWAEPAEERSEAEGRPCTELRVITGTKIGPLPG